MPVAVVTSRRIDFDSWDKASIGLPFGRGAMVLGEPVHVPRDADAQTLEALRQSVEQGSTRSMSGPMGSSARRIREQDAQRQACVGSLGRLSRMSLPFLVKTYRAATAVLEPAVVGLLYWRQRKGREDRTRLGERQGIPAAPGPRATWSGSMARASARPCRCCPWSSA